MNATRRVKTVSVVEGGGDTERVRWIELSRKMRTTFVLERFLILPEYAVSLHLLTTFSLVFIKTIEYMLKSYFVDYLNDH